jgi:CO dehydrogenase/acetyl-CoA synthase alpha subunit
MKMEDNINHPKHYNQYQGLEIIDLVEQMNFNRGNAVKYIARAGFKNPETEIEDLKKALWYIEREISRLEQEVKYNNELNE